jgi:hypothetical protein
MVQLPARRRHTPVLVFVIIMLTSRTAIPAVRHPSTFALARARREAKHPCACVYALSAQPLPGVHQMLTTSRMDSSVPGHATQHMAQLCCRLRGGAVEGRGTTGKARRGKQSGSGGRALEEGLGSGRRGGTRKPAAAGSTGMPAAGEAMLPFLPAELRAPDETDTDQWGRKRLPNDLTRAAGMARGSSTIRATNDEASRLEIVGGREHHVHAKPRRRRQRQMITFDLAELYPRCQGLGLNFTCPLKPTDEEFEAAINAAHREVLRHVLRLPPRKLLKQVITPLFVSCLYVCPTLCTLHPTCCVRPGLISHVLHPTHSTLDPTPYIHPNTYALCPISEPRNSNPEPRTPKPRADTRGMCLGGAGWPHPEQRDSEILEIFARPST